MSARITALLLLLASASCVLFVSSGCTTTVVKAGADGGAAPGPTGEPPPADQPVADGGASPPPDDGLCHPAAATGAPKGSYRPPRTDGHGLCTDRENSAYWECDQGIQASCYEVSLECERCIGGGDPTGETWGPFFIKEGAGTTLNSAGCAALVVGDTTTTGCGQALADNEACLDFTCLAKCPGDFSACALESGRTVCKAFNDAATAKCTKEARECYPRANDTSSYDVLERVTRRFCGPS